ncbi:hypothetical protein V6N13_143843 [Hibiscus sabdariffa]|uniref:Uncharacterized protein n=1 Tax=Hibiscus sabdariffa TaxID=183260 RepID=A0ABR2FIL0_9ROSI
MSNKVESAQVSDATEVTQLNSSAEMESHASSCDEEMPLQVLNVVVRSMPYNVVKDLLSIGGIINAVLMDKALAVKVSSSHLISSLFSVCIQQKP